MTTDVALLRDQDKAYLDGTGLTHTADSADGFVNLTITNFATAPGLSNDHVDLLLRLPFGFPDATPDMFWVSPALTTSTGARIPGTEMTETHIGRTWQRWSRHIAGQWRPGVDNLETYLAYVRQSLRQAGGN